MKLKFMLGTSVNRRRLSLSLEHTTNTICVCLLCSPGNTKKKVANVPFHLNFKGLFMDGEVNHHIYKKFQDRRLLRRLKCSLMSVP